MGWPGKRAAQVVEPEHKAAELNLRRGIVASEMTQESGQGDYRLLVLGSSRSPGGIVCLLMGNVSAEVVDRAHRPVLVAHPSEAQV